MSLTSKQQHKLKAFKVAETIALSLNVGHWRRAQVDGKATNYSGFKDSTGQAWVIGDTHDDIQNADALIDDKPARRVYDDIERSLIATTLPELKTEDEIRRAENLEKELTYTERHILITDALTYLHRAQQWLAGEVLPPLGTPLNCDAMDKAIEALRKAN